MNKIYNNLDIDNLMKSGKFKDFNEEQISQIYFGLNNNIDVSVYANSKFDWRQMQEIREGLENNLDVSIYAKKEYNSYQMKRIRKVLEKNRIKAFFYAKLIYYLNC